jgi:carbonic anhydrase
MIHPIELSAQQIAAFTTIYNHNNHPVQPVNGRTILAVTTP